MDMNTDSLAGLGSSKDPDYRHLGPVVFFRHTISKGQRRVQLRRGGLIVIDAVEAHAKWLHQASLVDSKAPATLRKD